MDIILALPRPILYKHIIVDFCVTMGRYTDLAKTNTTKSRDSEQTSFCARNSEKCLKILNIAENSEQILNIAENSI
jgi:hypothetical protein